MKLVELKCPACNGTMKMDPEHPGEAVCDYCQSRYIVESEGGEDSYRLGAEKQKQQQQQQNESSWYTAVRMQNSAEKKRQEQSKVKETLALAIAGVALVMIICVFFVLRPSTGSSKTSGKTVAKASTTAQETEEAVEDTSFVPWTRGMALVIGEIYGTDADQVSEQDLAKLRYLFLQPNISEMSSNRNFFRVKYSLEGDVGPDGELLVHTFEQDLPSDVSRGWDLFNDFSCLRNLPGLEKLNVNSSLNKGDLSGLPNLKSLGIRSRTIEEAAALLDDPSQIKELEYDYSYSSLEGIGVFSGLESLILHGSSDLTDIKDLAALKELKSLTLEYCPSLKDFSVLFVLTGLEKLSLDVDELKDISFVNSMPELKSFSVDDSVCLSFDPLAACQNLTELVLIDNYEVENYQAVSGLTGLTSLTLQKYSNQPDPDLSGLTQMTRLDVSGFNSSSFLRNMGGLTDLTIAGLSIDNGNVFEGLTNLTRFKGTGNWEYITNTSFLANLPGLTEIDLAGTTFYTDLSPVFNKQGLETLNLKGSSFELNFGRLTDNSSLKNLSMGSVKLYKNVVIQRSGYISQINWDDVALDAELGFLAHYPALEKLDLADNKLTQIQPASQLPMLKEINISKNYVTDLNPLSGLELLKRADCRENPVSNWQVLGEGVQVIK